MSQNAKSIGRRELLQHGATIAAVAAIPAAVFPIAKANAEVPAEDAELRELWTKYLDQLGSLKGAEAAHSQARDPYQAEYDAVKHEYLDDGPDRLGDLHRKCGRNIGLNRQWPALPANTASLSKSPKPSGRRRQRRYSVLA
jgi:hypothetical protein